MKTLDIKAKEWFDKINVNSYFSAQATIDFGLPTEKIIYVSFQSGYGDSYLYETLRQMQTDGLLSSDEVYTPSRYCREHNIMLRYSMQQKCLKREVTNWGSH